jgi:hypothetical protein
MLLNEVEKNLDSKLVETWQPFMSDAKNDKGIPPRAGYFIGYLIAQEIGKKMPMRRMAQLRGDKLRTEFIKALSKLRSRPPVH